MAEVVQELAQAQTQGNQGCKLLKVVFVGDSGVGKTCIIERLFSDKFDKYAPATIGTDIRMKTLQVDKQTVNLTLWDTAGQERYQSVTTQHYRGAHGVIFVYDVTRSDTLSNLGSKWMKEFDIHGRPDAVSMLVANKIDLPASARQVSSESGAAFAKEHNCIYHETSALLDSGIYDALVWGMVCSILDTPGLATPHQEELVTLEEQAPPRQRKKGICSC